ncbi:HAD family hydrolase [Photobacterium jeanii]|uniref:HAD family hydrolase n=1 Tax=Photobacterium jeanii TaxID=858640 RepID=A0A178K4A4_9GAMM|nr:HAD family phosphatase [Photobacterium jeanii]OAN11574.1 HAD family hydrolase [Photobacterium jeanii]PST91096.1 HAD family phosphatase [Photobacterium jeanii]
MIRNVIFDFGAVLFEWNPNKIVTSFTNSEFEQQQLLENVLRHDDWLSLDRGTMLMAEVIPKFAARINFPESRMEDFFDHVQNQLAVIELSHQLLENLLALGYPLYYLTNMSNAFFDTLSERHAFIGDFKGGVVSASEFMIKPEPAIFELLLSRYNLQPEECLFIDDNADNVISARQLGIEAVQFTADKSCIQQIMSKL